MQNVITTKDCIIIFTCTCFHMRYECMGLCSVSVQDDVDDENPFV